MLWSFFHASILSLANETCILNTQDFWLTTQKMINNISPNPPIHRDHAFQHIFNRCSYQKVATIQPCNWATTHYTCSACSGPSFMQASFLWQIKHASSTPMTFGETPQYMINNISPNPPIHRGHVFQHMYRYVQMFIPKSGNHTGMQLGYNSLYMQCMLCSFLHASILYLAHEACILNTKVFR
jgi:hypothetical protein